MAAPFLRWAGGKRQLLPILRAAFDSAPLSAERRYFEPFLGGAAFFFSISDSSGMGYRPIVGAFLGDMNDDLVNCYEVVRDDVEGLIQILTELATDTTEKQYYNVRSSEPREAIERAARLIYLNRLCFNGLYRLNRSGKFNVPYGKLNKPTVCDDVALRSCSLALQGVAVRTTDFSSLVTEAGDGDFVYLDPPYAPLPGSSSFASYHNSPFGPREHKRLADEINALDLRGANVVLSNSDTTFTREVFADLHQYSIVARRNIAAMPSSRLPVRELIGSNFEIDFSRFQNFEIQRVN